MATVNAFEFKSNLNYETDLSLDKDATLKIQIQINGYSKFGVDRPNRPYRFKPFKSILN
jgi:hypothetical protein